LRFFLSIAGSQQPKQEIPWLTALSILEKAHPYFRDKRGIGFGRLILMYQAGECKIMRLETEPSSSSMYRVQVAGSGITIAEKKQ
jgi:hypothetical protein